jgi:diguanylate cyclase (GGDEF)-like protein/PAS domain S-box-containing protein
MLQIFLVALYSISTISSFAGGYVAWTHREKPGGMPALWLSLCTGTWALLYIAELLSTTLESKLFWALVKYPAVAFLPIALAALLLRFAGWLTWPRRKLLVVLSIMPTLTVIVSWTNSLHHLFWKSYELVQNPGYVTLHVVNGPWFWVSVGYSYLLVMVSSIMAFTLLLPSFKVYRKQMSIIAVGVSIPVIVNVLGLIGLRILPGLDMSPLMFGVSILFLLIGTKFATILDVVTLAHGAIIAQLRDGLIVVDNLGTIIEINPVMENILEQPKESLLGKNIFHTTFQSTEILRGVTRGDTVLNEATIVHQGHAHWYEVRSSNIFGSDGRPAGRMVILHEITRRKQVEHELRYESTHDMLTGLFNRKYFEDELSRAAVEERWPVAVMIIDLDNLKRTNDTAGHDFGDRLLKRIAENIRRTFRQGDVMARIGGDEFGIIIPDCDEGRMERLIQRMRGSDTQPLELRNGPQLEFSIGYAIAHDRDELEKVKALADQRMYADKLSRKTAQE